MQGYSSLHFLQPIKLNVFVIRQKIAIFTIHRVGYVYYT